MTVGDLGDPGDRNVVALTAEGDGDGAVEGVLEGRDAGFDCGERVEGGDGRGERVVYL